MTRKTVVRLPLETKCVLAKFALENRNVLMSGETFVYRTNRDVTVKEAKESEVIPVDLQINGSHITDAMETYLLILKITKNLPKVQASVQEDILVAELKKKDLVIAGLTAQLAHIKQKWELCLTSMKNVIDKALPT